LNPAEPGSASTLSPAARPMTNQRQSGNFFTLPTLDRQVGWCVRFIGVHGHVRRFMTRVSGGSRPRLKACNARRTEANRTLLHPFGPTTPLGQRSGTLGKLSGQEENRRLASNLCWAAVNCQSRLSPAAVLKIGQLRRWTSLPLTLHQLEVA